MYVCADDSNTNHDTESNHVMNKPCTWTKIPLNKDKISKKPLAQQYQPIPMTANQYIM
jgi:hypothetical protein